MKPRTTREALIRTRCLLGDVVESAVGLAGGLPGIGVVIECQASGELTPGGARSRGLGDRAAPP